MHCPFFNFFRSDFLFPKRIYRERSEESDRREQARAHVRSGERMDRSRATKDHIVDADSVREAEPFIESIDPSPENQARLLEVLRAKFKTHMNFQRPSAFSTEVVVQYENILKNLPEAYLLQAITENKTEKELLDYFEASLGDYQYICKNTHIFTDVWKALKDLFTWTVKPLSLHEELEDENPGVIRLNTIIKPYHKTFLSEDLAALEAYYRERLEDTHGHWYGDAFNGKRRDFLTDHEQPFMRELFLNRAILQNESVKDLADHYSEYLKESFRNCIEGSQAQMEQAATDQKEIKERPSDGRWLNILLQMKTHVSATH